MSIVTFIKWYNKRTLLLDSWSYCDAHDKSTEFMLTYMQDVANVNLDYVLNFIEKTTIEDRQAHAKRNER